LNNLSVFPHCNRNALFSHANISDHMKQVKSFVKQDRQFFLVDSNAKVDVMYNMLKSKSEIAVDCEFDTVRLFRDVTCVIQISTFEEDFIIDPFLCFSSLQEVLRLIFKDESILKVVFTSNDVLAFQRDFNLYMNNVIDVQVLCNQYFVENNLEFVQCVSLKNAESKILGEVIVDKDFQGFPWIMRPLPADAINYAKLDSQITLTLWNELKSKLGVERIKFGDSNISVSRLYKIPENMSKLDKDWILSVNCLSLNCKNKIMSKYPLFVKIWEFRQRIAKIIDRRPMYLCNNHSLAKIIISKPDSQEKLIHISKQFEMLDANMLNELFSILSPSNVQKSSVKPVIASSTVNCNVTKDSLSERMDWDEWCVPNNKAESVATSNDQTNRLNREQTNSLSQASPTDLLPTPSSSVTPTYLSKTERNQQTKQRRKLNLQLANEGRHRLGLKKYILPSVRRKRQKQHLQQQRR
jgi:ribonuclease D